MRLVFIHVSDIHFGQEKNDQVFINRDVKKELVADAAREVAKLESKMAHGILVTGDIAQRGTAEEYEEAGRWLDQLAEATGCPKFRVQMVPGNHDLDRSKLSRSGGLLLDHIRSGGAAEYEEVLNNAVDREALFIRFKDYGDFADGYSCSLDNEGRYATNLQMDVAPGRAIRFIRFNSSLLCHGKERDENPELIIGERQFTIEREPGVENVVLVHHPLHWYKDEAEVRNYIRSRARVFISGHEHNPKVDIDRVDEGCDVLMLAAGATVPFKSDGAYTYTYNIIEFEWDSETDGLIVTMHPRAWSTTGTCFEADDVRLGGRKPAFPLGCPNFRNAKLLAKPILDAESDASGGASGAELSEPVVEMVPVDTGAGELEAMPITEGVELAKLHFFRDLRESERLRILLELDAIPADSDEPMNRYLERQLFDWLIRKGRLAEVVAMTGRMINDRKDGVE